MRVGDGDMAIIDNDEVMDILDEHRERISHLEQQNAVTQERLKNIEAGQQDLKNTVLSSNNTILQSMNSLTQTMSSIVMNTNNNNTELQIADKNNKSNIVKQVIITIGALLAGLKLADVFHLYSLFTK